MNSQADTQKRKRSSQNLKEENHKKSRFGNTSLDQILIFKPNINNIKPPLNKSISNDLLLSNSNNNSNSNSKAVKTAKLPIKIEKKALEIIKNNNNNNNTKKKELRPATARHNTSLVALSSSTEANESESAAAAAVSLASLDEIKTKHELYNYIQAHYKRIDTGELDKSEAFRKRMIEVVKDRLKQKNISFKLYLEIIFKLDCSKTLTKQKYMDNSFYKLSSTFQDRFKIIYYTYKNIEDILITMERIL